MAKLWNRADGARGQDGGFCQVMFALCFRLMKHFGPKKGPAGARVSPPGTWPNGSGVFSMPDGDAPRVELGRIVPEGTVLRAWRRVGDGYVDAGIAENSLGALMALPDPGAAPPRGAAARPTAPKEPRPGRPAASGRPPKR
jgi:hypothetical protein